MYDYIAVRVTANPSTEDITDLLASFLAEIEYETFESFSHGMTAYIRSDKFDKVALEEVLANFPIPTNFSYVTEEIEGQDWNKEWEQNYFKPILIDSKLLIRSTFHNDYPSAELQILIDPKMAFGTGHHATTAGMSRMLMEEDMEGKSVIDMGTGTGILSILAKKLGAGETTGIDIDPFAVENAHENGELNSVDIKWITGDEKTLDQLESADIFLANINLNIIKDNLAKYLTKLKPGGKIFLSGFLTTDKEEMVKIAERNSLNLFKEKQENGWETLGFIKK